MKLFIHDLILDVITKKAGEAIARVRPCDREFFTKWLEKVYAAKPWESQSGLRKVVKTGFLAQSSTVGAAPEPSLLSDYPLRQEVRLYPRLFNPRENLLSFAVFAVRRTPVSV